MIITNFEDVKSKIANSFEKYLINRPDIIPQIIAVSKTRPIEDILPLLEHGHRVFGENRVQEAIAKWGDLKAKYPDTELHLIGSLQTNKVKDALQIFDVIETLDREKLARKFAKELQNPQYKNKEISFFIQINTGEEPQKSGILPKDSNDFISLCINELGLNVEGLMCIAPINEPAAAHFALLKKIARQNNLDKLSMGMSADYELAAQMGADYVRVGTAIFGKRQD